MQRVKCFLLRHQVEGILTGTVYSHAPDQATIDAVAADLEDRHGTTHQKTGEPLWLRVQPAVLMVPDQVAQAFEVADEEPEKATRSAASGGGAPGTGRVGLASAQVSGVGTVTNPGEQNSGR